MSNPNNSEEQHLPLTFSNDDIQVEAKQQQLPKKNENQDTDFPFTIQGETQEIEDNNDEDVEDGNNKNYHLSRPLLRNNDDDDVVETTKKENDESTSNDQEGDEEEEEEEDLMLNFGQHLNDEDDVDDDVEHDDSFKQQQTKQNSSSFTSKNQTQNEDDAATTGKYHAHLRQNENNNTNNTTNIEDAFDLELFVDTISNAFKNLGSDELTQTQLIDYVKQHYHSDDNNNNNNPSSSAREDGNNCCCSLTESQIIDGIKSLHWDGLIYATNEDEGTTFAMTSVQTVAKNNNNNNITATGTILNNNAALSSTNDKDNHHHHHHQDVHQQQIQRESFNNTYEIPYRSPTNYNEFQIAVYGLIIKTLSDQFFENGRVSLPREALLDRIYEQLFGSTSTTTITATAAPTFAISDLENLESFLVRNLTSFDRDIKTRDRLSMIFDELALDVHIGKISLFAAPRSIFGQGLAQHYTYIHHRPYNRENIEIPLEARTRDDDDDDDGDNNNFNSSNKNQQQLLLSSKAKVRDVMSEITINPWRRGMSDFSCDGPTPPKSVANLSLIPIELRSENFIHYEKLTEFYKELQKALDPDAVDPNMVIKLREVDWRGKIIDEGEAAEEKHGTAIFESNNVSEAAKKRSELERGGDNDSGKDDHHGGSENNAPPPPTPAEAKALKTLYADLLDLSRGGRNLLQGKEMQVGLSKIGWPQKDVDHLMKYLRYSKQVTQYSSNFGFGVVLRVNGGKRSNDTFPVYVGKHLWEEYSSPAGIALCVDLRRILPLESALGLADVHRCLATLGWNSGRIRDSLLQEGFRRHSVFKADDPLAREYKRERTWLTATLRSRDMIEQKLSTNRRAISLVGGDLWIPARATTTTTTAYVSRSSNDPSIINSHHSHHHDDAAAANAAPHPTASSSTVVDPVVALDLYQTEMEKKLSRETREFWHDLVKFLPRNGDCIRKSIVSKMLGDKTGWSDRTIRAQHFQILEDNYLVGFSKNFGSADPYDIYRVVPKIFKHQPPRGVGRISPKISEDVLASFMRKHYQSSDVPSSSSAMANPDSSSCVVPPQSTASSSAINSKEIPPGFLGPVSSAAPPTSIGYHPQQHQDFSSLPSATMLFHNNNSRSSVSMVSSSVAPPSINTPQQPQQQHSTISSSSSAYKSTFPLAVAAAATTTNDSHAKFNWRKLPAKTILQTFLSNDELRFYDNMMALVPPREACTKASLLSTLNFKFKWHDASTRNSLFQYFVDLKVIEVGAAVNLANTIVVERNSPKMFKFSPRIEQKIIAALAPAPAADVVEPPPPPPPPPPSTIVPQQHLHHQQQLPLTTNAGGVTTTTTSASVSSNNDNNNNIMRDAASAMRWEILEQCPSSSSNILRRFEQRFLYHCMIVFETAPESRTARLPVEQREVTRRELLRLLSHGEFKDKDERDALLQNLLSKKILHQTSRVDTDVKEFQDVTRVILFDRDFAQQLARAGPAVAAKYSQQLQQQQHQQFPETSRRRSRSPPPIAAAASLSSQSNHHHHHHQTGQFQPPPGFFGSTTVNEPPPPPPPPQQQQQQQRNSGGFGPPQGFFSSASVPLPPSSSSSSLDQQQQHHHHQQRGEFDAPLGFFPTPAATISSSQQNQHQYHHFAVQSAARVQRIFLGFASPISVPPPLLIRSGVPILRQSSSRLMFAPPPFYPLMS